MTKTFTLVKGFTLNKKPVYECNCGALIGAWTKREAKKEHKVHINKEEKEVVN